jgi:hypothetical protein
VTTPNRIEEQVKAISEMAPAQLSAWMTERLERRDLILEDDDAEESSAYPIIAIARHLAPVVVEALHQATISLLKSWIRDHDAANADDLLLLIQGLGVKSTRDDLGRLARSGSFAELSEPLRYRVLQTLISLEANLEPSFWYGVYQTGQRQLAGVTFDGLALISPNHAIDFLSVVPENPDVAEQIGASLPGFMDDVVSSRDRVAVRALIDSRLPEMKPRVAEVIRDFFVGEQTPLAVLPLRESAPVAQSRRRQWSISSDNFPALSARDANLEAILSLQPENPPKVFANLAHQ